LLNGFTLALVYVLVALGLTLIFSIFEIINFAHGEFYMLGGYVTYLGFAVAGLPYLLTLLLAIVVVGLVGLVSERLIFRHLRGKTLNAFIVSLGLLWVLQAGTQLSFGVLDKSVPSAFSGIIRLGGLIISVERFVVVLAAVGLIDAPVRLLYTPWAVVVALAQIQLPLMVLPVITALGNIDPNLRHASHALGAGRWRTFVEVTLPLSAPGLLAGCLLVYAGSVSAFVTQTLVGGGQLMLMPQYMYQQAIQANNYPFAAAVAMILLVAVLVIVVVVNLVTRRTQSLVHG